ncbi:MAG: glycerophosphoryl diester phosphodiesterase [bacterium]|nr:MAG: glycerophosphoryl diester phosphodiesterase [bacterium]
MLIIGHRGASGTAPENTPASFEKAIRMGVEMIELDVHRCASGELVVIHDEKINRTTSGKGLVSDKTLHELQQADAGDGERIPTLHEVLSLVNRRAKVNIELKGSGVAVSTADLLHYYKENRGWQTGDFYISSFDHQQLMQFRELDHFTKIGILYEKHPHGFVVLAKALKATSVNIPMRVVSPELVNEIHGHRLEVWVYTVNNPRLLKRLQELNVEALFTNYPDRFLYRGNALKI